MCTQWGRHKPIKYSLWYDTVMFDESYQCHLDKIAFNFFLQNWWNLFCHSFDYFSNRNDKFADVLLFPSQMDGGYGIPAHKIILSSCSHVRMPKGPQNRISFRFIYDITNSFTIKYEFFVFFSLLCWQFFAQVFDSNPSPPNSLLYIVLPAEISRRSIQILIQYMYSGEATVSNDIL